MTVTSPTTFIDPQPGDWLNHDRLQYLHESILPLSPLLNKSNLLDDLLKAWLQYEITEEINHMKVSDRDEQTLLLEWCRQQWGHRIESLYLASKNKLDLVSYRILTVKTAHFAHELYYRLKGNEATFDQLCILYSIGKEKFKGGKFTDIPLSEFPSPMQSAFVSMQSGDLHKPIKNGDNFVVLQLLKYLPASLNQESERRLLLLQLKDWQQGMIATLRRHLLLED